MILRLTFVFLCALPAVCELYQYINDPRSAPSLALFFFCLTPQLRSRRAVRMGQHVWLLLATICTELLVIIKWGKGQFAQPMPAAVRWSWMAGGTLLVVYPAIRVRERALCSE